MTFEEKKDAENALRHLKVYQNKEVTCKLSLDQSKAKQFELEESQRKVYIRGLSEDLSEEEIRDHFEQFGTVEKLLLHYNKKTGSLKNFCFVVFQKTE